MNNFRQFPKRETVVEILDTDLAPHKYVFGNGMLDAQSKFESAVTGRSGFFVKARTSSDRLSETVNLNSSFVKKYVISVVDVPARISTLIDELETVRTPDEDGSIDEGREAEIISELTFYFDA